MMRRNIMMVSSVLLIGLVASGCAATDTTGSTTDAAETPTPTITKTPSPTLKTVTVVDGDTVKLGNGQSIRIIGVDTPERGECGYDAATRHTASLISGGVSLSVPKGHDKTDKYNRLLRYVTTKDGKDVGTSLLNKGLANARYDSLDGYDYHPKQDSYRATSKATAHKCPRLDAENPKTPAPKKTQSSGGNGLGSNCDPNYGTTCVPKSSTDLNCDDISGPVTVVGTDPHRFDGDNDGTGCESN